MIKKVRENLKDLGHLTPMAVVSTLLPIVGSSILLIFLLPIGHWLRENWELGILVFLTGTLFFCGLALLPTNVIGIVSGWAFSFELGLLVLMIGVVGASIISFVINTQISGNRFPEILKKHPRSTAIYDSLLQDNLKKTTLIILLLRLSVVMPFAFTNFLLAASRVPFWAFVIGTAAGMLPRSASMAFVGSGLAELNLNNTRDTYIFVIGAVASVLAIITIAIISRKALERLTQTEGSLEA
ncbi:MAG TPA: VTT domain-containing protein [Pyrinomonadaceae bacterium]|nr:VTT domain-containing protein [Pyrinomonadaceae bacterium]